jgi:hypothetical protein
MKLECCSWQATPISLMFASKARAYLREAPFMFSTQEVASGLAHKHYTRLENPDLGKLWPYSQILDLTVYSCQEQTL